MQNILKQLFIYFLLLFILTACSYEEEVNSATVVDSNDSNVSNDNNDTVDPTLPIILERSFSIAIDSISDDAHESSSAVVTTINKDLDLGVSTIKYLAVVGLRFNGLTIPKDSEITNAYIQFTADETSSRSVEATVVEEGSTTSNNTLDLTDSTTTIVVDGNITTTTIRTADGETIVTVSDGNTTTTTTTTYPKIAVASSLNIKVQNALNPATFSVLDGNISLRTTTGINVTWAVDDWISKSRSTAQQTSNLKGLVQEIVNQANWFSGNSIVFMISGVGQRAAVHYEDTNIQNAPELFIEYNLKDFDTDGDGIRNSVDTDDDNDGVPDITDAFPEDATESLDTDSDGIGNNADPDDDNDGNGDRVEIADGTDPLDPLSFIDRRLGDIESVVAVAKYHRVVWNKDASTTATIGFTPLVDTDKFYVKYGQTLDESQWFAQNADDSEIFSFTLKSHFVRMENLKADSSFYYRVCNYNDCGDRYWFRTAPNSRDSSFVIVSGSDTTLSPLKRIRGNQLISKIRPLFVMHGGSFTNTNTAVDMSQFFADWVSSYSVDSINGVEYKRIYPLVPTHGFHENTDYLTMCSVFGLDFNSDKVCTRSDAYGAFNVSPLLRVYTLNSELTENAFAAESSAMNTWLSDDLITEGNNTQWRIAQYSRSIFPHADGKKEDKILFNWWAKLFSDTAMNVVIEGDSNVAKITKIVQAPIDGDLDFEVAPNGGTLYIGEGSWATEPAILLDENPIWTQDTAAINQFKVIVVDSNQLEISTAELGSVNSVVGLTLQARENNSSILPDNIPWWNVQGIGETIIIKQNELKQSTAGN